MSNKSAKRSNKVVAEKVEPEDVDVEVEETPKVPTKPKVASKVVATKSDSKKGSKKQAKPENADKNAATAAKKKAENLRYQQSLTTAAEIGLVTIFEELTVLSAQDKWTNAVGLHILETINHIQQAEVRKEGDYNPYTSKEFILFEDKISSSGKKKSHVKTGKSESKSTTLKKKAPLKRGAKPAVEEPVEDADESPDQAEQDDQPDTDEAAAAAPLEEKEEKKKNITTFTRDAKSYLGFLVMRFVDDYFCSQGGKNVKNNDDFTNYTYTAITKDIGSHVSKSVVTSVNRLEYLVSDLPDRGIPDELSKLVGTHFQDRGSLIKFIGGYLSNYLKLIGVVLAQQLWVSRRMINQQAIDAVVRFLNLGNHEVLLEAKVATDSEPDYGLSCGFFQDAHVFSNLVVPKAPKKPRVKAATEDDESKPAKGKGANTNAKGKGARGKTKEPEPEEPEEDEEVEEDQDAEAEEDAEDQDAEAEDDQEVEEEAEEVLPAKPLRKLRH